jgi:LysM repeat protein
LSIEQTKQTLYNDVKLSEQGELPPRSLKHGKNNKEDLGSPGNESTSTKDNKPKRKAFYFIQFLLWAFLSIILFIFTWIVYQNDQFNFFTPSSLDKVQEERGTENGIVQKKDDMGQAKESESPSLLDQDPFQLNDGANEEVDGTKEIEEEPKDAGVEEEEGETTGTEENGQIGEGQNNLEESPPRIIAEHVVQPGETFYRITVKYYQSREYEDYLAEFNGIKDKTQIQSGMILKIPEKRY